jgi:hypothetical protein
VRSQAPPGQGPWARLAGIALLLLVSGCASFLGTVQKSLRSPGERFQAFPEEVWQEYDCDNRELPYFRIEKVQLVPRKLRAGDEFNHRIVYALCPAAPTAVVSGTLHTRILFRGRAVVSERDRYEFKPGRWVVDAFVRVPEQAERGIYSMELDFESASLRFEDRYTFLVEKP